MAADLIAFYIMAIIAVEAAVMVMEAKEVFHAALFLALLFVMIGGVYILLTAEFIAAIQVLVYAGAVIVLVLFAIVLTKRAIGRDERPDKSWPVRVFIILLFVAALIHPIVITPWPKQMLPFPMLNTYSVGYSLFTDYVIPFEIISIALLAALIGAIYLSKREVNL